MSVCQLRTIVGGICRGRFRRGMSIEKKTYNSMGMRYLSRNIMEEKNKLFPSTSYATPYTYK